jgi:hypothetical protein
MSEREVWHNRLAQLLDSTGEAYGKFGSLIRPSRRQGERLLSMWIVRNIELPIAYAGVTTDQLVM